MWLKNWKNVRLLVFITSIIITKTVQGKFRKEMICLSFIMFKKIQKLIKRSFIRTVLFLRIIIFRQIYLVRSLEVNDLRILIPEG